MELFDPPPQKRKSKKESVVLHAAIVFLRKKKHRVVRAGRNCHFVDGERKGDVMLMRLAKAEGFEP